MGCLKYLRAFEHASKVRLSENFQSSFRSEGQNLELCSEDIFSSLALTCNLGLHPFRLIRAETLRREAKATDQALK